MSGNSPYKKLKTQNSQWIGFINLNKLPAHRGHKIMSIVHTEHAKYGPGEQVIIESFKGQKWRIQLPGKYLKHFNETDIEALKADIAKGKNPFLVFREVMLDNSYRMDIIQTSPEAISKFSKDEAFDELEDSVTEDDQKQNSEDNGINDENGGISEVPESVDKA